MLIGMALIALSFFLVLRPALRSMASDRGGTAGDDDPAASPFDYVFGPASALCYASGFIARRVGLNRIPDAALGTFVSALAAMSYYLVAALVIKDYRRALREMFTNVNRAQWAAAILMSFGQLTNFAAIQYTEISRVVMILSLEVFLSPFLAVVLFKTERRPDAITMLAAAIALSGALLVAGG